MTATGAAGARSLVTVNILWLAIQFQDAALLAIIVPALLLQFAPRDHTTVLSVLATLAAIAATIAPPVIGAVSDRTNRRGGDRRIATGIALALDAAALIAMAFAGSTTALAVTLVVATLALNAAAAVYAALIPEVVPRASWGVASGVRGAMTLAGTVLGLGAAAVAPPATALLVTAGVVIAIGASLAGVPRRPIEGREHARVRGRRDLVVTMIARGWITLGLSLLNTYVLYYFNDVLHVHEAARGTALVAGAALAGAIASSVIAGVVSDRIDRRYVVAVAGIPMTVAALGFALAPNAQALFAYSAFFGLGFGASFSVGWALALDAVPALGDVARDLGAWFSLSNLPSIVAPIIGGFVLAHVTTPRFGYQVLFAIAALSFALGSLAVLAVRPRTSVT